MNKKIFLLSVYFLAFAVTVVNLAYSVRGSLFSDISDLPKGEFVSTIASPDDVSEIAMYKIEISVGEAVRCELRRKGKTRNVFWQTGISDAEVHWINNRVVVINGVQLDVVGGGFYDCRRGVSLFQEGSLAGDETPNEEKTNE